MRRTTMLLVGVVALGIASGCNAVFGLDDKSYGEGGAGGGATSTSDTSTSDTSTSDASTSDASASSSGGADLCETKDWIVGGDFAVDSETLWDDSDNTTITAEVVDGDRVMRIQAGSGFASATQNLSNEAICAGGCIRVGFEVSALASFDFGVGVADDDTDDGGLRLLSDRNIAASETFELIETEPCLIPADFVSPDRVSFAFDDGGDMYVDDVMLIVDDCPAEAVLCERF